MRKKVFFISALIVCVAVIVLNISISLKTANYSNIILENTEALAQSEITEDDCDMLCKYSDNYYCLIGNSYETKICNYTYPRNL